MWEKEKFCVKFSYDDNKNCGKEKNSIKNTWKKFQLKVVTKNFVTKKPLFCDIDFVAQT